jgi:photosystem II stability/assembly factor-like uncharacterized protein
MTDLEMAGREVVARELVPLTPIEQIRARAAGVARRRRARRRAGVALAVIVLALGGTLALTVRRSDHEPVATTPSPVPSVSVTTPTSTPSPSTAPVALGPTVTSARVTSADLGMAATYDPHGARLWVTHDSVHWVDVTPTAGIVGTVEDVLALDPEHLWAVADECGTLGVTVWRSLDGGHTWSVRLAGAHSCSAGSTAHLQFLDPQHGWLVLSSTDAPVARLEATYDGGATWHVVDEQLPELGDLMFVTPTDGYLGASPSIPFGSNLYVTHDSGRTWARVTIDLGDAGLPNPSWQVIYGVPTFVDDSTGILPVTIAKADTAAVEWWETTDGGASWHLRTPAASAPGGIDGTPEPTMSPLLTSVTGPHVWWVLGHIWDGTHSFVTTDAGGQWTDTNDATLVWPDGRWFGAANADVAWVLGAHLFATTDGGHTWHQIDPPG